MEQVYTKYDPTQSYEWNYRHAPAEPKGASTGNPHSAQPAEGGNWRFLNLPVASPVGIAAGPLLNGRWLLHYAELGFDILTYKTVRSRARVCYELPNLQPVAADEVTAEQTVEACPEMRGSWAISFGMPSQSPDIWTRDLAWTRERLPSGKVLVVSVVATAESDWGLPQVAEDYALCARLAAEHGADAVEVNFSCPNVQSVDGQLYQDMDAAVVVAEQVREAIPQTPVIVKLGLVQSAEHARQLLESLGGLVDAFSMTNCIACRVQDQGRYLFEGQPRGIGGAAIRSASMAQIAMFSRLREELRSPVELIGVGGISNPQHAHAYLEAGANSVQVATAAMLDPLLARKFRGALRPV